MKTLTYDSAKERLPVRKLDDHKGSCGKVLLLCGSRGYTGAAALSAMGALRSGSGLVYLGVPESIYVIEAIKLTEPIVFPLPEEQGKLSDAALSEILCRLSGIDAVLIGPGLGMSPGVETVVTKVLQAFQGTIVLDADGINVMKAHKDIIRSRTNPTILTPHPGEFVKFCDYSLESREDAAKQLALDLGAIVVLKGHNSVITDGVTTYINPTGNPGMAVGGSGDVLSGMIVSFLGQGMNALDAAACGVWFHGKAGDVCSEIFGQRSMLPSDMLEVLPQLLK